MFRNLFKNSKNRYTIPRAPGKWQVISHYLFAICISIAVIYIKYVFNPVLGHDAPFLLLFSAILFSGWLGGFGPAFLATVLTTIGSLYLFFPHDKSLQIDSLPSTALFESSVFMMEGAFASILLETKKRVERYLKEQLTYHSVGVNIAQYALNNDNLQQLFENAMHVTADTLRVKHCAIWELQPDNQTLQLRSGIGWHLDGHQHPTVQLDDETNDILLKKEILLQEGQTLLIPQQIATTSKMYALHVLIPTSPKIYGVVSVYKKNIFHQEEIYLMQTVANMLATAIEKDQSEVALRESQFRFQKLFDSHIIGITIADEHGIMDANNTFLHMIGYHRDELPKLRFQSITPPEYSFIDQKGIEELREKGYCTPFEKEYIRKDGTRVPVLLGAMILDKEKFSWICFVLDVTRQKVLEKRKDDFISIASHELKTPVTSLKVFTQLLEKKFKQTHDEPVIKYITKMDNQIDKLTQLINDLLNVTKIQTGKLEFHRKPFYLPDLIQDVIENTQPLTTQHTIQFTNHIQHAVYADPDRISQVLINLISNAIKYSPDGGDITLNAEEKNGEVVVSVQDNGIGIDKKYLSAIFERFFRINEEETDNYPGLGIGLYLSFEIIRRHDGTMWVDSTKGKGSTFYFSLPLPKGSI